MGATRLTKICWKWYRRAGLALAGLALIIACGGAALPGDSAAIPAELPTPTSAPFANDPGQTADTVVEPPQSPAGMAGVASPQETPDTRLPKRGRVEIPKGEFPLADTSLHSVPLSDILFDTFGGSPRFLPLDKAKDDRILALRDAIAPIRHAEYEPPDALSWLKDDSLILGYVSGQDAYAYPINVLNMHEIVNDVIDGVPVLITYCPLCFSGVVYHREMDGQLLTFGNTSALYQSDLVMYDHQTGSYWFQVGGEAVVGELTCSHLDLLPSSTMAWGEWKRLYPQTELLTGMAGSANRFNDRRYSRGFGGDYQGQINDEQFIFPVDEKKLDSRLSAGEIVLTVEVGGKVTAFPLDILGDGVVNHQVGAEPVAVFIRATDGPMSGVQLTRMNTRRSFWFSIAIALPGVDIYTP